MIGEWRVFVRQNECSRLYTFVNLSCSTLGRKPLLSFAFPPLHDLAPRLSLEGRATCHRRRESDKLVKFASRQLDTHDVKPSLHLPCSQGTLSPPPRSLTPAISPLQVRRRLHGIPMRASPLRTPCSCRGPPVLDRV